MNFLALSKRVHLLLRIGEEAPGTAPTTVADQEGVEGEIVQWVAASHNDICRKHPNWLFMIGTGTFPVPEGTRTIAESAIEVLLPDFGQLAPMTRANGALMLIVADGVADSAEMEVEYIPYSLWGGNYDIAPLPTGMPTRFTLNPSGGIEFDSTADRDYTLRFNYRKDVADLADDEDEPMFGTDYHNAIVWWAIVHYYCATRDGTEKLLEKADRQLRREMTKLQNEQLPDFLVY